MYLFTTLLIGIFAFTLVALPADIISFPDHNLEAILRRQVSAKRNTLEPLTRQDMRNLYEIDGKASNIRDLTGLENCEHLMSLNLADNQIVDIRPLQGLTDLQSLDLSNNKSAVSAR